MTEYTKIDDERLERTDKRVVSRKELMEEREEWVKEKTRAELKIARIDSILEKLNIKELEK